MAELTDVVYDQPQIGPVPTPVANLLIQATTAAATIVSPKSGERQRVGAVHDLRVALRRLNVVATTFADKLPRSVSRKLKRRTKKLRRYAGSLRDMDIMHAALVELKKESSELEVACSRLLRELDARRPQLLQKLQRALSRRKYKRLWKWTDAKVVTELDSNKFLSSHMMELATEQIGASLKEFLLARVAAEDHAVDHLHALRIKAKRLRYTIELFESYGVTASGSEKRDEAENWQDELGRLQDLTVLAENCKAIAAKSKWTKSERMDFLRVADVVAERHYRLRSDLDLRRDEMSRRYQLKH